MTKNRILLVIGVVSLLLVTMAVSRPFTNASVSRMEGANDFYQRHQNWGSNAIASDYYERHPERSASIPVTGSLDAADYFQRHPELNTAGAGMSVDVTDYFIRHPELSAPAQTIDVSDFFLRH